VDIVELKKSNAYIEKELQSLEIIDAGDTIRLKDSVMGLDIENRILSVERNPILEINTKLEIANTIELITDTLQRIETESVKQGKSYNFASISSEYGFRARRSDQLAQATLGGGILSFDVGDGTGQYTQVIYFDVSSKRFKIIGDFEMQGGSIDWTSVDSPSYSYNEITGSKPPIDADNTNSVIGTRLTHIDQYGIYTGLLEAEQVSAGILRGITLDLDTDARIGYNLRMGNTATLANRMIEFYNAGANDSCFIGFSGNSLVMSNSAGDFIAGGKNIVLSAPGAVSIHALSGGTGTFLDGPKIGINPTVLSFFGVSGGGKQFVSELPYGASADDIVNQINALSYGLAQLGLFDRFEI
jgi:hypothetical protein